MHRLLFAGCSFTHSGDSWAYQGQPNVRPKVEETNSIPGDWGKHLVQEQGDNYAKKYGVDKSIFEPATFWANSHNLPEEQYEINIFGRGSNSNTDTARCIMHFIENYEHNIDTVVMQLSGFARRELFTSSPEAIEHANTFSGYDMNVTTYDDANFIKHWGAVNYKDVLQENPPPDSVRKASAYFYSVINEPEEYHIRAIEQLQNLTNFCKVNNIKLAYFNGWQNYPAPMSLVDHNVDHTGLTVGTEYFNKKYDKYVRPYLLEADNLIQYADDNLERKFVFDLHRTESGDIEHGSHPSPMSHQLFWNDIVYPFVVQNA